MLDYATVNDLKTFLIFVEKLTWKIDKLTSKDDDRMETHEEYLRSLLAIVQRSHKEKPSWRLFAWMLKAAFKHEPLPFDDTWLSHTRLPRMDGTKNDFDDLKDLLLYQIADLHAIIHRPPVKTKEIQWDLISPNGYKWENTGISRTLNAASRAFRDGSRGEDSTDCDWRTLAIFLRVGQIYE